ncbi:hypothetical protein D9757_006273 [Collybiopsis confluens]|uniref:HIT domain-containing protein n=1 Tax=Collybiopsis confluens TaxID=2823264 RepID=A0A8H5HJY3_9AGAR|nr:hypothetical protein D9757_006273 [Collybiopsis confluens]
MSQFDENQRSYLRPLPQSRFRLNSDIAFLDISPVSEGHTQVIPKYHAVTIADLPDEYLADIGPVVKKVAVATGAKAYNVLQASNNNGKLAFQHVDHVHFHVIPKTSEKDGLILDINLNWPQRQASKDELASVVEKIKAGV